MAVGGGDSVAQLGAIGYRPQRQQRLYGVNGSGARVIIGHQRHIAESEVLTIALIIAEEKELVAADGAAERTTELIALKFGDGADVEIIARVEDAVAEKFVHVAVDVVCAGHGNDADLRSSALAIVRSVSVGDDVEFAYGVDSE